MNNITYSVHANMLHEQTNTFGYSKFLAVFKEAPRHAMHIYGIGLTPSEVEERLTKFRVRYNEKEKYSSHNVSDSKHSFQFSNFYISPGIVISVDGSNSNNPTKPITIDSVFDEYGEDDDLIDSKKSNIVFLSSSLERYDEFYEFATKNLLVHPIPSNERKIHIITQGPRGLDLSEYTMPVSSVKSNEEVMTNYNDDFVAFDEHIRKSLKDKPKGIIMLHGVPGTGKTSYIRTLITTATRKVIYVPNEIAKMLGDPSFMTLLHANEGAILVIEDAEEILAPREDGGNPAVSNILNLCDGILSDILSISVVATFNSSLNKIDSALRRKGRLIGEYEFKPLSQRKASVLMQSLYKIDAQKPMTLAEIYNFEEQEFKTQEAKSKFGFTQ